MAEVPLVDSRETRSSCDGIEASQQFQRSFSVSRETMDRFDAYRATLESWQRTINLVAPSTVNEIWTRHFSDSAQLFGRIPANAAHLVDLGSGAGFPGLVLAILAADTCLPGKRNSSPPLKVTLVESDTRKAAFLREVARQVGIAVDIVSSRIESMDKSAILTPIDVVTSRALAPLPRLLELMMPLASLHTVGLFLKGRAVEQEITEARLLFLFDHVLIPSVTDAEGRIVEIRNLQMKRS